MEDVPLLVDGYGEERGLSSQEVSELRIIFEDADGDGSGYLDLLELKEALHRWEKLAAVTEVGNLFRRFDVDGSGSLDFEEFLDLAAALAEESSAGLQPHRDAVRRNSQKKVKLLALHGAGGNANISRLQLQNLGFANNKNFDVVYVDAPFECEKGKDNEFTEGPYFTWLGETPEDARKALRTVLETVQREGPFAGIYGFSLGGAVALSLLQFDVLETVLAPPAPPRTHFHRRHTQHPNNDHSESSETDGGVQMLETSFTLDVSKTRKSKIVELTNLSAGMRLFDFAVVACPAAVSRIRLALGLSAEADDDSKVGASPNDDVRTAHLIGLRDPMKPVGEANVLKQCDLDSDASNILLKYLPIGHELPRTLKNDPTLTEDIERHVLMPRSNSNPKAFQSTPQTPDVSGLRRPSPDRFDQLVDYDTKSGLRVDVSPFAVATVARDKQLVTTQFAPPPTSQTLEKALAAAPPDSVYIRGKRADPSKEKGERQRVPMEVTFGDLKRCAIRNASEIAAVLRLDELRGLASADSPPTLAYATPPDGPASAAAAVAFFTFACISAAAPFDASTPVHDAIEAFQQLNAATVVIWRDGDEKGIRKAAMQVGARLYEATLRSRRSLALFFDEIFSPDDDVYDGGLNRSLVARLRITRPPEINSLEDDENSDDDCGGPLEAEENDSRALTSRLSYDDRQSKEDEDETPRNKTPGHMVIVVNENEENSSPAAKPLKKRRASRPSWAASADRIAILLRTSGTTSKPKIVALSDGQITKNGFALGANLDITATDVCLNAMPLFHIGGLSASILATLATQGAVTCLAGAFSPENFADHLGFTASSTKEGSPNRPSNLSTSSSSYSHHHDWPLPTWYSAVPTVHNAIVSYLSRIIEDSAAAALPTEKNDQDNDEGKSSHGRLFFHHRIRFVRSGAAALSPYDARRLSAIFGGVPVIATYSMSEQMPITQPPFGFGRRQLDEKPGTVGVALATSLMIVDERLEPIGDHNESHHLDPLSTPPASRRNSGVLATPGGGGKMLSRLKLSQRRLLVKARTGQIAISGPTVMREYLDNPAANASSFFVYKGKRWFLTGDVGLLDDDGHLRLTGRSKELIKRGGEQISPYEVEDVLMEHDLIATAVVFAVPSELWGEEVGVAIVPTKPETVDRSDKRAWAKVVREAANDGELAQIKIPTKIVVVDDDDLPKTKTRKYIRANLAQKLLHIGPLDDSAAAGLEENAGDKDDRRDENKTATVLRQHNGVPQVSPALSGARYVLVLWTMFQHFGSSRSFGKWKHMRGYNLHMPMFFALAGFQLASGMAPPPQNLHFFSKSHRAYFWARFSAVHPLYLLSIVACALILLIGCRPDTYRQDFHWEADKNNEDLWQWSASEDDDGDLKAHVFCEPTPVDLGSWGATYASTIAVFVLGLQAWPFAIPIAWWLSYYTWFQSVYYFCLFVFPFVYRWFYEQRGKRKSLLGAMALLFFLNTFVVCGIYLVTFFIWARGYEHRSPLSLAVYLFPPFWTPYFFAGTASAFLLDAYRPYDRLAARRRWGWAGDLISLYFLGALLSLRLAYYSVTPPGTHHNKLLARIWSYTISRLHFPFVVAWLFAVAVGEGRVAKFLATNLMAKDLGPLSFACYLFHQPVGALYYALTRNAVWQWWRYRKFLLFRRA